jgi:hypothetical protein
LIAISCIQHNTQSPLIVLIVNLLLDRFIPLLLELMESPSLGLRGAATEVVVEVVNKRMEPVAKIQLVQQLKTVPALANWTAAVAAAAAVQGKATAAAAGGGGGGNAAAQAAAEMLEDEETLGKYARLLAVTAGEVMDALKRVENSKCGEPGIKQQGSGGRIKRMTCKV